MADYIDIAVTKTEKPARIYERIQDLLVGTSSVEVIPDRQNETVILRVWVDNHCPLTGHRQI